MVQEIKGPGDLQSSLLMKEPLAVKSKKVAAGIKGDYKLSLKKRDEIKEAVSKGFDLAKDALGGMLPEISSKTFDAVVAKFDEWAASA